MLGQAQVLTFVLLGEVAALEPVVYLYAVGLLRELSVERHEIEWPTTYLVLRPSRHIRVSVSFSYLGHCRV